MPLTQLKGKDVGNKTITDSDIDLSAAASVSPLTTSDNLVVSNGTTVKKTLLSTLITYLGSFFSRKDQADTISGAWNFSGTAPTIAGSKIWTQANDGAGTGLDADILDGYLEATAIKRQTNTVAGNLGSPSVEEMALFHGQFTNKLRFIPAFAQEESTDGITWVTSTRATSDQLRDIMIGEGQQGSFTAIPSPVIGVPGAAYRLTWDTSQTGYVYLNALYIYNSTSGNQVNFKIEQYHNTNGWSTLSTGTISNWPGHTYLPHSTIGFSTAAAQYGKVRITFQITTASTANAFTLYAIEWFGGYPAGRRNVEYYDRDKNVTFPARITGTRLAATVANGTSPMDITSQTLVTNLNADLLDGFHGTAAATASTYALRDSSADIACRLLRPNFADQASIGGAIAFRNNNSTDNYVRFCSDIAAVKTFLQAASSKFVGSANIDSYLGDGFFEFDPTPTGTPPISSPNLRVLSIGRSIRNTQMAFTYESDRAWFRRKTDSVWAGWCEFYHSGNLSTLFTAIKTVDGTGSGLDADLLDGKHASEFAEASILVNQTAHGFAVGNAVGIVGTSWVKAKADSVANAVTLGLVSQVVDANNFRYVKGGVLAGTYTAGANYFLSTSVAGGLMILSGPEVWTAGHVRQYIGTGNKGGNGLDIEIDLGDEIVADPYNDRYVTGFSFTPETRTLKITRAGGLSDIDVVLNLLEDIALEARDIEKGTAQSYVLDMKASCGYSIESIVCESDGGLSGVSVKINTTAVGGLSSLSVGGIAETNASTPRTVSAGDKVTINTSSSFSGSPSFLRCKLKIKKL